MIPDLYILSPFNTITLLWPVVGLTETFAFRGRELITRPEELKVEVAQSCPKVGTPWTIQPWNTPGQSTGADSLCLLQGIFPTQGSSPSIPH